ncbi:hypothetical protein RND81_04G098900 [Saponaria officinalis]|uniref:F-box domain-containing protein n=1 Tax=Saponaria officinalis TaxID=3572 RepID=A0AAW1LK16_SAPOF
MGMILSTKCRKVLEMRDGGSLDRISSLPDELLGHILSFLPTLNAVQTSMLSTRWRYLFTLTTNLSFDEPQYFRFLDKPSSKGFKRFINGVLALHIVTPIQKFSLKFRRTYEHDYQHQHLLVWISAAILKGVKHLELDMSSREISLPNCIFYSQTLVTIDITTVIHKLDLKVPGLVCLPSLRVLKLDNVTFLDGESIKRFFGGCSQLKELVLLDCELGTEYVDLSALALEKLTLFWCRGHLEINAPNLTNLSYLCSWPNDGVDMTFLLKNPCSPSTLEVGFRSYEFSGHIPQFVLSLIRGAQNARELILTFDALKLLTRVDNNQLPTYAKLESLYLDYCCYDTWKCVTFWLANSPQLKTIVFNEGLLKDTSCDTEQNWHPSAKLAPFSSNVETIEVHGFEGQKSELLLLNYLLENARVLKRLILYKCSSMKTEDELQVSKELLMLPKASTYCTIQLK